MARANADTQPGHGHGTRRPFGCGLTTLLEIFHAAERVRVDGDDGQQIGDGTREGLLLAYRGLSEYVELQLQSA